MSRRAKQAFALGICVFDLAGLLWLARLILNGG